MNIGDVQGSVTLNFVRAKEQTIYMAMGEEFFVSDYLTMAGIPTCEGGASINLTTFTIVITGDGVINMALSDTGAN